MGFCDVIFGWDMEDALYDKGKISGWHAGFPDSPAVLDVHTFRKIPWENDLPFSLVKWIPFPVMQQRSVQGNYLKIRALQQVIWVLPHFCPGI